MTEEQIERAVERKVDFLDARLMAHLIDQQAYNQEIAADAWAKRWLAVRGGAR